MLKSILKFIFQKCFNIEVFGLENYEKAGEKALIVANHLSFLDGLLLALFLPEKIMFAVNTHVATRWYFKPLFTLVDIFPLDPLNPMSLKKMITEIKSNRKCAIFPEGRITVTGSLMKIYEGPSLIADKTNAQILPVRIDGSQYSYFSRMKGKVKLRLFPKITLHILEPRVLHVDASIRGRKRRQMMGTRLYDLMTELLFNTANIEKTLFKSLIECKKLHGREHLIIEDPNRQPLNYGQLLARSFILGKQLSKNTQHGEALGMMLPNMNASVVAFFGLQAYGRVPVMLNYSTGVSNLKSACDTAVIKKVITSRKFIEKGKLEFIIEGLLEKNVEIIYLEDLATHISLIDKLQGLISSYIPSIVYRKINQRNANDAAVILFTSGSEGTPKGVALSHTNIQANRVQATSCIDFVPTDILFNCLPIFHSFGLTIGTLLPVLMGVKVFLYPSPLHYRIIPELVYDTNATVLLGTDTFLAGYARFAHNYDFYSLRYIFAAAEKLKEETRKVWSEKYGVRVFEAYGSTETAPGVTFNTPMYNKANTVGRLFPGIEAKVVPVEGIKEGGKLIVSGPNIMLGYLYADRPGEIVAPENNEYDTGDIVTIDEDKFITIVGRSKRFAKIGGEMVSLPSVETSINKLWPEHLHAVVNIPDGKKGEALVLITTQAQADRKALMTHFKDHGISELALPKHIKFMDKLPVLGTGKTDYVTLGKLALAEFAE